MADKDGDLREFEAWARRTLTPGAQANIFESKNRDESITWQAWVAGRALLRENAA